MKVATRSFQISLPAVHIARNYTTSCDPKEFSEALAAVEKEMQPAIDWLDRPIGSKKMVEYMTWSDVYRCRSVVLEFCIGI